MTACPVIVDAKLEYGGVDYPKGSKVSVKKGSEILLDINISNSSLCGSGWIGIQAWDSKNNRQLAWVSQYISVGNYNAKMYIRIDKDSNIAVVTYSCAGDSVDCKQVSYYGDWVVEVSGEAKPPAPTQPTPEQPIGSHPVTKIAKVEYGGKWYGKGSEIDMSKPDVVDFYITVFNNGGDGWCGIQVWDSKNNRQLKWLDKYMKAGETVDINTSVKIDRDCEVGIALYSCSDKATDCKQTCWYGTWKFSISGVSPPTTPPTTQPSQPTAPSKPLYSNLPVIGAIVGSALIGVLVAVMRK